MHLRPYCLPVIVLWLLAPLAALAQVGPGRSQNFDAGWLFSRTDPKGAEQALFADADWRKLDVPHDWSVESPVDQANRPYRASLFLLLGYGSGVAGKG